MKSLKYFLIGISTLLYFSCTESLGSISSNKLGYDFPDNPTSTKSSTQKWREDLVKMSKICSKYLLYTKEKNGVKILAKKKNKKSYAYVKRLRNQLMSNSKFNFRGDFRWKIILTENDTEVIQAFGDYIFIDINLVKTLTKGELAGALAFQLACINLGNAKYKFIPLSSEDRNFLLNFEYADFYNKDALIEFQKINTKALNLQRTKEGRRELRDCIYDADRQTVKYLLNSGYSVDVYISFLSKMKEKKRATIQKENKKTFLDFMLFILFKYEFSDGLTTFNTRIQTVETIAKLGKENI